MKYRNTNIGKVYLEKYHSGLALSLSSLHNMPEHVRRVVISTPKIAGEDSLFQSYLIYLGYFQCIGSITIYPTIDEATLYVNIYIDPTKVKDSNAIYDIVDNLIDHLKTVFYKQKRIQIEIDGAPDLELLSRGKYRLKKRKGTTVYRSNNEKHQTLTALQSEMKTSEETLTAQGFSWTEVYACPMLSSTDAQLEAEYNSHQVPRENLFERLDKVSWVGFESASSSRNITFKSDGHITYSKDMHTSKRGLDYDIDYNVTEPWFKINGRNNQTKEKFTIEYNSDTGLKGEMGRLTTTQDQNGYTISYRSGVVFQSSIDTQIGYNSDGSFNHLYIDYHTHRNTSRKRKSKINGQYMLRIDARRGLYCLEYVRRKGTHEHSLIPVLKHAGYADLLKRLQTEPITPELLNQVANAAFTQINIAAFETNRLGIYEHPCRLPDFMYHNQEKIHELIHQIASDTALPHLRQNLRQSINSSKQNTENNNQKLVLKSEY